jgi:hypothetical protein
MPEIYHYRAQNVPAGAQHVFIAIPVGAPVDAAMLDFTFGTAIELTKAGIHADLCLIANNCHVDDCRNHFAYIFLAESDCTDFLFVDADTASSHDAVKRILSHDRDIVAGLYPYKGDDEAYPVRLLADAAIKAEADGCVEVQMVPTGFLRIRRHVLEALEKTVPGYWTKEVSAETKNRPIPLLFERAIEFKGEFEGRPVGDRWGGDYNFCRKWREAGGRIYVDPTLHFRHYGTKAYKGNVGVHWAKQFNTATPGFDEAVEAIRSGSSFIGHFGRLAADWGNPFAAPPELLSAAHALAMEADGPVLETGSGLSTVVLGLSGATVHALEHDVDHYGRTVAMLKRYGLGNVRLHYAPLRRHEYAPGRTCLYYEIPADLPASFAAVLCDGPPRRFGRDGLFKVLGDRITGAKVLFDDADDKHEVEVIEEWAARSGRSVHVIATSIRPFAASVPGEATLSTAA